MFRIARASVLATLCALPVVPALAADTYPERPIRLIVPFSPGGGTDINARILAEPIGNLLGETIVVDNRPGAASLLGSTIVAQATPDGYTLLLGTTSLTVASAVYKEMPFSLDRDLIPITRVSDQPSILVVNPSLPAKTFKDFVALARSRPGKLTFGSPGHGTSTHLAEELLWIKLNAQLLHVPFKGTGPAVTALIGNQISTYLSTFASALPHVKQNRLRAYAVTTLKRAEPLPDVPTLQEEGVQDYEYAAWYGLFVPGGTPQKIVAKIHKAAVGALKSPKVLAVYKKQGLNATPTTPAAFAKYIAAEKKKWAGVVREARIQQM